MTLRREIDYSESSSGSLVWSQASWRSELVRTKTIIFPTEEGFNVLIWGKWASGRMRVRSFDNRTSMIALLEDLGLISHEGARELESFEFVDYCPLYASEVDEETLEAHGFRIA